MICSRCGNHCLRRPWLQHSLLVIRCELFLFIFYSFIYAWNNFHLWFENGSHCHLFPTGPILLFRFNDRRTINQRFLLNTCTKHDPFKLILLNDLPQNASDHLESFADGVYKSLCPYRQKVIFRKLLYIPATFVLIRSWPEWDGLADLSMSASRIVQKAS